jgi:uncharacterized membrane protein
MAALLLATVAFLALHVGLSAPAVRPRLVAAWSEWRFRGAYSALALLTLGAMIWAYGRAPAVPMWEPVGGMRWFPIVLMLPACLLLVAGLSQRNPTAVGQGIDAASPATGIVRVTRHPVMWAFGLWTIAHLAANGTTRGLLLFGGLAALALLGTRRIDAKRAAQDPAGFARLAAATSNAPFGAILDGRQRLGAALAEIGPLRLAGGIALYAAFWLLHPWVVGRAI